MCRPRAGRSGGRSWESGAHLTLSSSILEAGQATDWPRACGLQAQQPLPAHLLREVEGGRCQRLSAPGKPEHRSEPPAPVRQKKALGWESVGTQLCPQSLQSPPQSEPLLLSHLKQRRPDSITSKNPTNFVIHISGIFLK